MTSRAALSLPHRLTLIGFAVVSVSSPAIAEESYFPLHVGNTWEFATEFGGVEVQSITRTDVVRGRPVYVNSYIESGANLGLEQYWLDGKDGETLLGGWWRKFEYFGILYDPPVVWVDAPLAPGKSWSSTSSIYELPGEYFRTEGEFPRMVFEAGPLTVPAGTFDSFEVGQGSPSPTQPASLRYELDGTAKTNGMDATDWYSAGIGLLRYGSYSLTSYESPTPIAAASWGRVKRFYR